MNGENAKALRILVLPGDGIGPEITSAAVKVLEAADAAHSLGLDLETRDIGLAALETSGTTLPTRCLREFRKSTASCSGPFRTMYIRLRRRAASIRQPHCEWGSSFTRTFVHAGRPPG